MASVHQAQAHPDLRRPVESGRSQSSGSDRCKEQAAAVATAANVVVWVVASGVGWTVVPLVEAAMAVVMVLAKQVVVC